jgi:hypothetical protein
MRKEQEAVRERQAVAAVRALALPTRSESKSIAAADSELGASLLAPARPFELSSRETVRRHTVPCPAQRTRLTYPTWWTRARHVERDDDRVTSAATADAPGRAPQPCRPNGKNGMRHGFSPVRDGTDWTPYEPCRAPCSGRVTAARRAPIAFVTLDATVDFVSMIQPHPPLRAPDPRHHYHKH